MKKAQFATAAPRNYLQKGHSNATSPCNAATSPVLTQIIICHVLLKQIRIPAETTTVDSWIPCSVTSHSTRNKEILSRKIKGSSCKENHNMKQSLLATIQQKWKHHVLEQHRRQKSIGMFLGGKTTQKSPQNITFIPTTKGLRWLIIFI